MYSTTYHSSASKSLQNIKGTDYVVFVLILFPQMSNIFLLKSVPQIQPQISNKIMWPYYLYVVLYYMYTTYICTLKKMSLSISRQLVVFIGLFLFFVSYFERGESSFEFWELVCVWILYVYYMLMCLKTLLMRCVLEQVCTYRV